MAKIELKRPIRFTPGADYTDARMMAAGVHSLEDEHLEHPYITQLIREGVLVVVAEKNPNSVEIPIDDMTIAQLKGAITAIKADFDFTPLKKKADFIDALKALREPKEPGE